MAEPEISRDDAPIAALELFRVAEPDEWDLRYCDARGRLIGVAAKAFDRETAGIIAGALARELDLKLWRGPAGEGGDDG